MEYPYMKEKGYHHPTWAIVIHGEPHESAIVSDLVIADYALREVVQREEKLQHRVAALQKAMALESDRTQYEEASQRLEDVQKRYYRAEYALFKAEFMLPRSLKSGLDLLRQDDIWYMRKELADDCSSQGGCCSRGCGCCSQRRLSKREKGRGHCTAEGWCCTEWRGFELPENEKQERRKGLITRLTSNNRAYLLRSASSFLCPPPKPSPPPKLPEPKELSTPPDISKAKSRWRQIFG